MKYSYLHCEVNGCLDENTFVSLRTSPTFVFLKTSRKIRASNIVRSVNEFMTLCEKELQQNNVICVHGYYTKKSHVASYPIDNTKVYSKRPITVAVGWKTLRDKFKRRFGKDIEILHKKRVQAIVIKNVNIGNLLLKDL